MSNPWLKMNPFLSMWLSSANLIANTLRGQATAEVQRQTNTAITKATRENLKTPKALTQEAKPPAARAKRKR